MWCSAIGVIVMLILSLLAAPLATEAQHALPVGSIYKDFAEAGGLIAYGPNLPTLYRRADY